MDVAEMDSMREVQLNELAGNNTDVVQSLTSTEGWGVSRRIDNSAKNWNESGFAPLSQEIQNEITEAHLEVGLRGQLRYSEVRKTGEKETIYVNPNGTRTSLRQLPDGGAILTHEEKNPNPQLLLTGKGESSYKMTLKDQIGKERRRLSVAQTNGFASFESKTVVEHNGATVTSREHTYRSTDNRPGIKTFIVGEDNGPESQRLHIEKVQSGETVARQDISIEGQKQF